MPPIAANINTSTIYISRTRHIPEILEATFSMATKSRNARRLKENPGRRYRTVLRLKENPGRNLIHIYTTQMFTSIPLLLSAPAVIRTSIKSRAGDDKRLLVAPSSTRQHQTPPLEALHRRISFSDRRNAIPSDFPKPTGFQLVASVDQTSSQRL